jgi:DNA-binding XRE family transcriptional regulator
MQVLEVIAEKCLSASFLRNHPTLKDSLIRIERAVSHPRSKEQADSEKERIVAIDDLLHAYRQEQDAEERQNIVRTLEELVSNTSIDMSEETIDDFESRLLESDREYAKAAKKADQKSRVFLKKYFSLKARRGLSTQEDVAKKTGLARSYIAVIESGEHRPQQKTLQKLSKAFGVDISEFI